MFGSETHTPQGRGSLPRSPTVNYGRLGHVIAYVEPPATGTRAWVTRIGIEHPRSRMAGLREAAVLGGQVFPGLGVNLAAEDRVLLSMSGRQGKQLVDHELRLWRLCGREPAVSREATWTPGVPCRTRSTHPYSLGAEPLTRQLLGLRLLEQLPEAAAGRAPGDATTNATAHAAFLHGVHITQDPRELVKETTVLVDTHDCPHLMTGPACPPSVTPRITSRFRDQVRRRRQTCSRLPSVPVGTRSERRDGCVGVVADDRDDHW